VAMGGAVCGGLFVIVFVFGALLLAHGGTVTVGRVFTLVSGGSGLLRAARCDVLLGLSSSLFQKQCHDG